MSNAFHFNGVAPAPRLSVDHHGMSGTWRDCGREVVTLGDAERVAWELQRDGYGARVMLDGRVYLSHEELLASAAAARTA